MEWEPIESAPKDKRILVGWWDFPTKWEQEVAQYHDTDTNDRLLWKPADGACIIATHWMPLPAEPK